MTHRGPFQPLTFCDSVITWFSNVLISEYSETFLHLNYFHRATWQYNLLISVVYHLNIGYLREKYSINDTFLS